MSETVCYTGKAIEIPSKEAHEAIAALLQLEVENFADKEVPEIAEYLKEKYAYLVDLREDYWDELDGKFCIVEAKDEDGDGYERLFELISVKEHENSEDIAYGVKYNQLPEDANTIYFVLSYYNGGCGFEEAFADMIKYNKL